MRNRTTEIQRERNKAREFIIHEREEQWGWLHCFNSYPLFKKGGQHNKPLTH